MCPSEMPNGEIDAVVRATPGWSVRRPARKPWLNQTLAAYQLLTRLGRKFVAKHWKAARRFYLGRFVLKNVPMLRKLAIFKPNDIGGDP
jgi:hypothetical protein